MAQPIPNPPDGADLAHAAQPHAPAPPGWVTIYLHLLAGDPEELAEKVAYAYDLVRRDVESCSALLAAKPDLVALTTTDLMTEAMRERLLAELRAKGLDPVAISAATGEGLEHLRDRLVAALDALGLIEADAPHAAAAGERGGESSGQSDSD